MTPIYAKALLELAVSMITAITNEVMETRRIAKRDARSHLEKSHDRPS